MKRLAGFNPLSSPSTAVISAIGVAAVVFYLSRLIASPVTLLSVVAKALGLGATYAIIALGFVLVFKATQVVNFAQGAMAMVGALFLSYLAVDEHIPFTTWKNPLVGLGPTWFGWGLSFLVALIISAAMGLVLERVIIRPMVGKPLFSVAVITLGLETILRTFSVDAVQIQLRSLALPWGTSGFTVGGSTDAAGEAQSGGAFIAWAYLVAVILAALSFVAIFLFYRSRLGVAMRAVAFDQEAAMAQGINVGRVFAFAWAAGAILATLGGILATQPPVAQTGSVAVETQLIAFRALPAVILGGLDSVSGALMGGLIVGLAEITAGQYLSQYTPQLGPGYPLIVPYLVMIIGLLVRPYGVFGSPEIRRV